MKSLLLLSSLAATCLGAAVPLPQRDALFAREDEITTVIITITSTTTLSSSTIKTTTQKDPWFPWSSFSNPGAPVTVTIDSPVYITVTATDPDDGPATSPPPRITFYPPRNAAPAPEPQILGSPSRTVEVSPTPPWWNWWPHATLAEPSTTFFPRRDAAPEPQVLGSPTRTVLESPTPPPWWYWWPSETPIFSSELPRTTFYSPRNAGPEPQVLGSPSRTILEAPTPPIPWWWNQWPSATSNVIIDRDVDEKREPQTLNFPSRTNQITPTGLSKHHHSTVVSTVFVTVTENPYEIDATLTLPLLTLDKRDPQTLDFPPSRTEQVTPTGPSKHHHSTTVSTVFVTVTENPYVIDETATLPLITLKRKREPQSLGPPSPSRTNEITPTGPSKYHHSTAVSTVYVTITEYEPSSTSHHHPHTITTETIIYSVTDYTPLPTDIDTTITLPFFPLPTIISKDKRAAEAEAGPDPDPQISLVWPSTSTSTSRPKENPCQNNIFPPPEWCFGPTSVITITITETGNVFKNTATLAPLTLGSPPRARKDRRARQRVEKNDAMEKRQEFGGAGTRSFSFIPAPTGL